MSLDTAKCMVAVFLSHKPESAVIGFYGGEPLLELELMKDVVAFAEQLGTQNGVELRFNITTNGTLLSEETIHYLVAHKFAVMISVDGDKESHDRYRVFKDSRRSEQRRGSFDVIIRNMERFAQLYPDYLSRGFALTLTATADLSNVEQFVKQWKPLFPSIVSTIVAPVQSQIEAGGTGHQIEVGEYHTLACSDESCLRRRPHNERPGEIPEFDDWSASPLESIRVGIDNLASRLRESDDVTARRVCDESPICENLLRVNIEHIHQRPVVGSAARKLPVSRLSCFPGAARTYCSSQGVIYPCERVDFGKLFQIGDATSDVDVDKACDFLVEMLRLSCDCGNCILHQVCTLCPAQVTESREFPGYPDFLAIQKTCGQLAAEPAFAARLRTYTEIMEADSKILDGLYPEKKSSVEENDWLSHVTVLTVKQEDVELGIEELGEFRLTRVDTLCGRKYDGGSNLMAAHIGIVDTGVDREHPCFKRRKPNGIGVRREGENYRFEPDFHDLHGHGTAMASLIRSFCRQAQIYVVRIAQEDENGVVARVQEQALAMGIEWCVDQGIRIVNVSYNIAEATDDGFLARVCQKAHEKGTILVAAYRNGEKGPVYPAALSTVIGVRHRGDLQPGQVSVLDEENLDLYAWGTSNSIATAQVTAMVGRIHTVDDRYGLEEVFAFLTEVAVP